MSYKIKFKKQVDKFLVKLAKSAPKEFLKIDTFLKDELPNCENPCALPSAKHLQGYSDNRWRWKIGDYRIIGIVQNGEFKIIEIVEIARRQSKTYSNSKK